MSLVALSLETLGELDGGLAGAAINKVLASAVSDLEDRGKDGKPRKVVITLTLTQLEGGQVVAEVDSAFKGPPFRTGGTVGQLAHSGGEVVVAFQRHNPENPDQPTLDDYERGSKRKE